MQDDQRVKLTKRLLKEGLLRLLKTKELDKISISELCAESGINRATFYRHYQEPHDILNELRRDVFKSAQEIGHKSNPEKNLINWLEAICNYFYDNAELLRLLFKTRNDEEFVALLNEQCQVFIPEIRKKGVANELDDDSLRIGAYYFAGGIFYILRQWLSEPINKTPKEIAALIYFFLTEKGDSAI